MGLYLYSSAEFFGHSIFSLKFLSFLEYYSKTRQRIIIGRKRKLAIVGNEHLTDKHQPNALPALLCREERGKELLRHCIGYFIEQSFN